jgi:polysaccharide biosynthesis protein PelF
VRVALVTEAGTPADAWARRLIGSVTGHTFHLLRLEARGALPLPAHVASVRDVPPGRRGPALARADRPAAVTAAMLLFRGMLTDSSPRQFADGLHRLAALAHDGRRPLHGVPTTGALLDAVRAARGLDDTIPRLTLRQARHASDLLERALRPLAIPAPDADLTHASASGPPLLIALAARWRTGTPYLLTEHDIHLRRQYLAPGDDDPVRAVLLRFHRALARLGYESAALVIAAARFHRRWQLRHGADPERVLVVPPGLDDPGHTPEPTAPVLLWRGTIGPDADLPCLISALSLVRARVPDVRLLVDGPVADPSYARHCRDLTHRLGLDGALRFVDDPHADGQVAVATAMADGVPYPLVKALMGGRPAVATDVGAAAETVGDGGLVVPPGEPGALADACTLLLTDHALRQRTGATARRRALARHAPPAALLAYDHLYRDLGCR